ESVSRLYYRRDVLQEIPDI
ncbi:unnamed protein product, partial [Allacma fusca]